MARSTRKKLSKDIESTVLTASRRRCCVCYGLERDFRVKRGQIAHLDHDRNNNALSNLAFLCFDHHDMYDGRTSQSKGFQREEIEIYRAELEKFIGPWSLNAQGASISMKNYNGRFERKGTNEQAYLSVAYAGANRVQVTGLCLWGTNNLGGPNIGEIDFTAPLDGDTVSFTDPLAPEKYSLTIYFDEDSLHVSEKNALGYFGMNASFEGQFTRVSVTPDKGATLPAFGINYMRLFGALETALLLNVLEYEGDFKQQKFEVDTFSRIEPDSVPIGKVLFDFWKERWEYKQAIPIKTELWQQLAGNKMFAKDLYWTALSPTVGDIMAFARNLDVDPVGDLPEQIIEDLKLDISNEDAYSISGTESTDIGFLFLIITNNLTDEIFDVELNFTEYENPLQLQHGGKFSDVLERTSPKTIALMDSDEEDLPGRQKRIRIASMKPGKSILWILSAYRKNKDGLPEFYLTKVIKPSIFSYTANGDTYSEKVRAPYGIEAARITVPSGWFHQ